VSEEVRDVERAQAAPAHPQQRQALPLRRLPQGVHPVLQPVPTQANARRLPTADPLRQLRPGPPSSSQRHKPP